MSRPSRTATPAELADITARCRRAKRQRPSPQLCLCVVAPLQEFGWVVRIYARGIGLLAIVQRTEWKDAKAFVTTASNLNAKELHDMLQAIGAKTVTVAP